MRIVLPIFFLLFNSLTLLSQIRQIGNINFDWDVNTNDILKKCAPKKELIYYYRKKNNNKDSILIMSQYFDTSGRIIERDEFDLKDKQVWRISNFTYTNDLLSKKEVVYKYFMGSPHERVKKDIIYYEYDMAGNCITDSTETYRGDGKMGQTSVVKKEYDSLKNLVRQLESFNYQFFTHYAYSYGNGRLYEVKAFDYTGKWLYSYDHQYNSDYTAKSIFLVNPDSKRLSEEFIYDSKERMISRIIHDTEWYLFFLDHSTETYSYNPSGLVDHQTLQDQQGKNYYLTHYYTNQ